MKNRIEQIMRHYGLTATQFATEIGIQRSALSHIMSGRNKPSLDFVIKMKQRYSEINTDWLLLGFGNMFGGKQPGNSNVSKTKDSHNEPLMVKSEEQAPYGKMEIKMDENKKELPSMESDDEIERIVFFFKRGTFKTFKSE